MPVNRSSLTISSAQKTAFETATTNLETAIEGFQVVIDKEELKSLAKLADRRIPFVEKVGQYAFTNPEFLQPFADTSEFNTDFAAYKQLREMIRPLRILLDKLEVAMMVSGSEAYDFARLYYKAVQYAAHMGVPGAQAVLNDLRPLFEQQATPPVVPPTP